MVLTASGDAFAQASSDVVTVTGSRVSRTGFTAPTPLTVIGEEEIDAEAPANLAQFIQNIPSVVGSSSPATSNTSVSSGTAGVNSINLRALGADRTLVLLDGRRSPPSLINGTVDVNTFPQGLVERVEVVTGGASAAYGSDAVSGVVNFILDTDYEGLEIEAEAGETTYGDDQSWKINATGGMPFANGKGHVLANFEITERDGIYGVPREWNENGWYIMNNPAYAPDNGQPERLLVSNAGLSIATPGGIIVNTELAGTYFGDGGAPSQFIYGDIVRSPWMVGGQWEYVQVNNKQALHADERRKSVFGRVSYELTDSLEVFAEASWNQHASLGYVGIQSNQGNVVIQADNAFLPASVRDRAAELGISQFNIGTTNADLPIRKTDNTREVLRLAFGAEGDFAAFGSDWTWDAYYQHGETSTEEIARDITNNARLAMAQDAVFSPDGSIVCRSTLTDPGNGCVPFNRIGTNVNIGNDAAYDYIIGHPQRDQTFTQDVAAVNLSGEPLEIWAGPVSVAVGAEYRREEVSGFVLPEHQSGWFVGNYKPSFGDYDVKEAYFETVVPLMANLDLNGAVRVTDYSTSGAVTTWKVGATYRPIPDILFRATRSRDIRAPNLAELFQAGSTRTNNLVDPFNDNNIVQFRETSTGNTALEPEIANAWGLGAVLQPSFLPGVGLSVDYYEIEIEDAIGSVSAQTIVDRCYEGKTEYCDAIIRGVTEGGAQVIEQINVSPFNFAEQISRGIDVEATYRVTLADLYGPLVGDLGIRFVGTKYLENYYDNGIDTPTDTVGQNEGSGPPDWMYRLTFSYYADPFTVSVTGRGISEGVYNNSFIECTSNCPTSTSDNRTISSNYIAGAFYIDTTFTWAFDGPGEETEVFFNVKNLLNEDPEIVANGPGGSAYGNISTNQALYDILGRVFRVGVRARF